MVLKDYDAIHGPSPLGFSYISNAQFITAFGRLVTNVAHTMFGCYRKPHRVSKQTSTGPATAGESECRRPGLQ
jgi:hypothetical protein